MKPTPTISRISTLVAGIAITAAAALSGCGGPSFVRAPGAKKYRALPSGSEVKVAENAAGLAQPTELIGTLQASTSGEPADKAAATAMLQKYAGRYGCDAVVVDPPKRREREIKKRTKSLGKDGRPVYANTVTVVVDYDWTGQCIRTAAAPKAPAIRPRTYASNKKAAPAASSKTKPDEATEPVARDPDPPPPNRAAPVEPQPAPVAPPPTPEAPASPAPDTGDPKLAAEVARAFMTLSAYLSAGNADAICTMLDAEKVVFNVRTRDPVIKFKQDLSNKAACKSFKSGELAAYLRDFGPAEVHAEVATLVPTLFGIHRGAYLQLPDDLERKYADDLAGRRTDKKPLACYAYFVRQADNLFVTSLSCRGVEKYRVLLRRDGESAFKVLNYTHLR